MSGKPDGCGRRSSEAGSALLVTILVMAITLGLGISMVTVGVTDLEISGNYRSRATAYYAADSGLQQTVVDLRADPSWIATVFDPADWSWRNPFPSTVTLNGMAVSVAFDGGGAVVSDFYTLGGTRTISGGSFDRTVQLPPALDTTGVTPTVTITTRSIGGGGTGIVSSQVIRADIQIDVDSYTVWDNAIFAGEGQAGGLINGNVAIRGSVHIVGDINNPPTISFGGTADIRNNYSDAVSRFGATDAAKLPALPMVDVNGVAAETLDAVVRLEHGTIDLTGAADIGTANDDSNSIKETVDSVRTDGTIGPANKVHTDETGPYDSTGVSLPSLDDPYYDVATGTSYLHHRDYLDTASITVNITEISSAVADFSFDDGSGNSISWDQSAKLLTVSGIVRFDGDVQLGRANGPPANRGVAYAGTATLYSTNDVQIDGWLVPVGNYIADGNLGIIAARDVVIDQASQINVMAAIFAEDHARVTKQTTVAGSMVADYFDMGTNVPAIFNVPSLSANLPPGMPGSVPVGVIDSVQIIDWFQEAGQ